MPKDVEFMIMLSTLVVAFVAFVAGWIWQRARVARGLAADVLRDVVVPPPLSDRAVEGYEPPRSEGAVEPPPLCDTAAPGWWRVSTAIYNRYDLLMVGFLGFVFVLPVVLMIFGGEKEVQELSYGVALLTVVFQLFIVTLVTGFVAFRKGPIRWLGLKWRLWPLTFPIAIFGVIFTWGVLAVLQIAGYNDWLQAQMGDDGKQEVVKAFTEIEDPMLVAILAFLAVIIAPVTEEIIFRGYLYPVCKRFIGRWAAVIFSALIFALIHQNAQAMVPLVVLAVLLTISYEMTGSIWAPIGMHMAFNGATVAAQLAMRFGWIELPAT